MAVFRDVKTLQNIVFIHASIHNYFNQDGHLNHRDIFKQGRAAPPPWPSGVNWRPEGHCVSPFYD